MDEPDHRDPVSFRRCLLAAALGLSALAGCEQLGLGKKNGSNTVVPEPPQRRPSSDVKSAGQKPAQSPVRLDGSAAGNDSPVAASAPGLIAGQAPEQAAGPDSAPQASVASDSPHAGGTARVGASVPATASDETGTADEAGTEDDPSADEYPTLKIPVETGAREQAQSAGGSRAAENRGKETPHGTSAAKVRAPAATDEPEPVANSETIGARESAAGIRPGAQGQTGARKNAGDSVEHADFAEQAGSESGRIVLVKSDTDDPSSAAAFSASETDRISIELVDNGTKFKNGEIAAMVGGAPIFAEDVLRQLPPEYQQHLAQCEQAVHEGKVPPEEFRKLRRDLIEKGLQQHIDQELLLQALKQKLKDEQIAAITKQLDAQFNIDHLPQVMKNLKVESVAELDFKLRQKGSSIDAIRDNFRNQQLAHQFLIHKALPHEGFDLPDVRKYYQKHKADYAVPAKAKWEQIQLKFSQNGGKEKARKKAAEAIERLNAGEVFAEVAKELSNSPNASSGGLWMWTAQGSYKAKAIDDAVFEREIGEIGSPIETATSIDIIRVIDRTPFHYQPFEDVQDEIKDLLKNQLQQKGLQDLLKELHETATIEKFTDRL